MSDTFSGYGKTLCYICAIYVIANMLQYVIYLFLFLLNSNKKKSPLLDITKGNTKFQLIPFYNFY